MMKHLKLPSVGERRLPFYLAAEEWCARRLPPDEYFFAWRVNPTVICGRNQDMTREVNLDYCRANGIDVVRRRSGGGCVYADLNNFMFSYVCPGDAITATFARYTGMIASVLRGMGVDAAATGRNDIVVNGRKIAGNAFYHLPGRCIAHGTMLYDIDAEAMSRAITPSRAKLESKAVLSVPMRVTCARREGIALSREDFGRAFAEALCDGELSVPSEDIAEIETIEQSYYAPAFLYRKGADEAARPVMHASARFDGVGEIEVRIAASPDGSAIEHMEMTGDFFLTGDPQECIFGHLKGTPLTAEALKKAVARTSPEDAIAGLDRKMLFNLLTELPLKE